MTDDNLRQSDSSAKTTAAIIVGRHSPREAACSPYVRPGRKRVRNAGAEAIKSGTSSHTAPDEPKQAPHPRRHGDGASVITISHLTLRPTPHPDGEFPPPTSRSLGLTARWDGRRRDGSAGTVAESGAARARGGRVEEYDRPDHRTTSHPLDASRRAADASRLREAARLSGRRSVARPHLSRARLRR